MLVGGSRSGKTFLICRAILSRAVRADYSRHGMFRLRGNAARASLWLDTLPKVARLCYPGLPLKDHRQDGYLSLPNSSEIWIGGLDDKDRTEKILGQEYSTIYFNESSQIPYGSVQIALTRLAQSITGLRQRAYYDLNPVGKGHWSHRLFVQGIDPESRQPLVEPSDYRYAFLNPLDNAQNLSLEYLDSLRRMPERRRRRFYSGEYVDEIDGALWSLELLELARSQISEVPSTLRRVVVAVDPSGTDGEDDGGGRHDEVGIIVGALGDDGIAYILADLTTSTGPEGWGRIVVAAYDKYGADAVVAETNFGGAMVRYVIQTAGGPSRSIPVYSVVASRGKAVRAEPVAALYGSIESASAIDDQFTDQRQRRSAPLPQRVRHVWSDRPDGSGDFSKLEDELLQFSTFGYQGTSSPNRADAAVWLLTHLLLNDHLPALAAPVLVGWRPPSPEYMPAPEQRTLHGAPGTITLDPGDYETLTERRGW